MIREPWQPKHTINLVLVLAAIIAIVLLATLAEGQYVREVIAFVGGLLIPGSALPTMMGGAPPAADDPKP